MKASIDNYLIVLLIATVVFALLCWWKKDDSKPYLDVEFTSPGLALWEKEFIPPEEVVCGTKQMPVTDCTYKDLPDILYDRGIRSMPSDVYTSYFGI